jgi:hypothetical protein
VVAATLTAVASYEAWFDIRDDPAYADFFKDPDAAAERAKGDIGSITAVDAGFSIRRCHPK